MLRKTLSPCRLTLNCLQVKRVCTRLFLCTISESHKYPGLEIYDGREGSARWFTFTGNHVGDVQEVAFGEEAQEDLTLTTPGGSPRSLPRSSKRPRRIRMMKLLSYCARIRTARSFKSFGMEATANPPAIARRTWRSCEWRAFLRATGRRLTACSVSRAACERNGTNRAAPSPGAKSASPKRLPWAARSTIPEQAQNLSGTKKCGFRLVGATNPRLWRGCDSGFDLFGGACRC